MDTARCATCKKTKRVDEFAKNRSRKNGLQARCKACRRQFSSQPEEQLRKRHRLLKWKYGLTLEQYQEIYQAQAGCCAICSKPESSLNNAKVPVIKALAVDHDHETGRVRGLLCHGCNIGLGYFYTQELLRAASLYLNETAIANSSTATT